MNFSNFSCRLALGVIFGLGVHTTASATPVSLVNVVDISNTYYGDFVITVNSEFSAKDIQFEITNNIQTGIVSYSAYTLLSDGLQPRYNPGHCNYTIAATWLRQWYVLRARHSVAPALLTTC